MQSTKLLDPFGILKEREIQVRSSHPIQSAPGGKSSIIVGEVLVTRHPCKVPTDVQKVASFLNSSILQFLTYL